MTQHVFLMVCMVRPLDKGGFSAAWLYDVNQALVAGLGHGWSSVPNLSGTFFGSIDLLALSLKDKRAEAQSVVKGVIRKVLAEHDASFDVIANVALMIDGLGDVMIFET
jgi:hypothetical protein